VDERLPFCLFGQDVTDPNGNVTTSRYDADRRRTAVTSPGSSAAPAGLVTSFAYDPDGRVIQTQQSASGSVLTTTANTYTLTGQMASTTDANSNVTRYAYDAADRLLSMTDAAGRVTGYGYDAMGRRTAVFNAAIQAAPLLQQGYTPDGLQGSLTDANGHATVFAYDGLDRLGTTTYPDSSTEVLGCDADGNVLTRQTRKGDVISFTYDTLNRRSTKAAPSEPTVTYSYDLAGRVTGVSDNSAAIVSAVPPSGTSVIYAASYSYDARNQLTGAALPNVPAAVTPAAAAVTFTHGYVPTNRRISQAATDNTWLLYPAATPATTTYTANAMNQYTAVGSVTPTYDGNGNLTFDGTFTYGYDAESRLTSASQGGTSVAAYAYDAQGRRKSKTVGGTTTVYVTDADNREVLEYDGTSGAIGNWYAYGLGLGAPLNQINVPAGTRLTFIPDIQGSVLGTLDSGTGTLTKTGYLVYGESNSATGTFRYTGLRIDPETNGLYYARARMYQPGWGRFLQTDPIGYAGGADLYTYVANDPLNNVDPLGLWQATLSGGLGFGGALTFGYNSGQWNIGAYLGPAVGANFSINPANATTVRPGVYTSFVGSAEAEVGPIAVDVGASAQTTVPQGRVTNNGTASVEASANLGAYSVGGEATINPNGSVTVSPKVIVGLGTSAYSGWGVVYQSAPSQPATSVPNPQPSGIAPASSGAGK